MNVQSLRSMSRPTRAAPRPRPARSARSGAAAARARRGRRPPRRRARAAESCAGSSPATTRLGGPNRGPVAVGCERSDAARRRPSSATVRADRPPARREARSRARRGPCELSARASQSRKCELAAPSSGGRPISRETASPARASAGGERRRHRRRDPAAAGRLDRAATISRGRREPVGEDVALAGPRRGRRPPGGRRRRRRRRPASCPPGGSAGSRPRIASRSSPSRPAAGPRAGADRPPPG